ncbi:MAG: ribonuclease HII [Candidatus Omnitrophota bacterium]
MLYHERRARKKGYAIVVGVDEAGRGPLAGPVVAAAVFLKTHKFKARIDDSKKLKAGQRATAFEEITQKAFWGVGVINEGAIDELNIARATNLAVDRAINTLLERIRKPRARPKNTFFLLDGTLRLNAPFEYKEIIGGDGKSLSIAAASIVAKVVRDRIMAVYDRVYPQYGFAIHKGYGTKVHRENIARLGISPIHRRSFCGARDV